MGPLRKDVCTALQVRTWLAAEWLSEGCLESTGQAYVCQRVGLKPSLAFSCCVALVNSCPLSFHVACACNGGD